MTIRGGGRPRDGRSQAHQAPPSGSDGGRSDAGGRFGAGGSGGRGRLGRSAGSGGSRRGGAYGGRGGGGRFLVFALVLAAVVLGALGAALTVLRPVVAGAVVDWASDNPTALGIPFVADLVREDLGQALTKPASEDPGDVEFVVQSGDTASTIADRLAAEGLLTDARAFVFIATERQLTGDLEVGTYILRRNMTPQQLVTALLQAKEVAVTIQLREGLRLEQITAKLETLPITMDVREFYELAKHPPATLLADYPWLKLPKGASLEGFLAPATYLVRPDIDPEDLIRKLLDRFYESVGAERLAVPKDRGLTFYQLLTLASIVEREAVLEGERELIAGVYQNRLNKKPRILNADPTVFYALDSVALGKLDFADWQTYSFWSPPGVGLAGVEVPKELQGYQSYQVGGLPPGPICTPSVASIDAALHPNTETGYFYFLAVPDASGKHAFAKTLAEHNANKKKYGYS